TPVEVGLLRLAAVGDTDFRLGSDGIEQQVAAVLASCTCGGRFRPGAGAGSPLAPRFEAGALPHPAAPGRAGPQAAPTPAGRRAAGRPRAMLRAGREGELGREAVLRLRLEDKLPALQAEVERATAAGDTDAAEAAHARYIELGTTYVRRFVRSHEPAA